MTSCWARKRTRRTAPPLGGQESAEGEVERRDRGEGERQRDPDREHLPGAAQHGGAASRGRRGRLCGRRRAPRGCGRGRGRAGPAGSRTGQPGCRRGRARTWRPPAVSSRLARTPKIGPARIPATRSAAGAAARPMRRKRPKKRPAPRPKRCARRDGSPESRLSRAPPAARTFHSSVSTKTTMRSCPTPLPQPAARCASGRRRAAARSGAGTRPRPVRWRALCRGGAAPGRRRPRRSPGARPRAAGRGAGCGGAAQRARVSVSEESHAAHIPSRAMPCCTQKRKPVASLRAAAGSGSVRRSLLSRSASRASLPSGSSRTSRSFSGRSYSHFAQRWPSSQRRRSGSLPSKVSSTSTGRMTSPRWRSCRMLR